MAALIDQMRHNPKADWAISDIQTVCRTFGVACNASKSGSSHYKVAHPSRPEIITIPFKRPIKPIYVRKLVSFVDAVSSKDGLS